MRWILLLLPTVAACTAQIRDDHRIASDPLIQTASAAASSQPLGFKSWTGPSEENDQAVQAVREVRLDEAESLFEMSMSRQPLFALAYINLARLYLIAGEPDRARRVYQSLVSQKEFTDQELFVSGRKLYEFSRVQEGISLLEVLAQNRPAAPLLTWLGSYKLGLQDYASADSYFDGALALSRTDSEALFGRGYIRYLAQDFGTGADFFGRAQTAGSRETRLCVLRLTSLFRSGRLEEAEKEIPGCKTPGLEAAEIKARILLVLHPLERQTHTLSDEEAHLLTRRLPGIKDTLPANAVGDLKLEY